jgi:hypothetical protein
VRTLEKTLPRIALGFGAIFVFRILTEVGLLSPRWHANGILFRWQVWLLAAIVSIGLHDLLFLKAHENGF